MNSKKALSQLILAVGDPYLTQDFLQKKSKEILSTSDTHSIQKLFAKDISWESVINQAQTLPFLTEKQIFWIKGAEQFKEQDFSLLKKYFENPTPFSFFFLEGELVTGRKKVYQAINDMGGEYHLLDGSSSSSSSKWKNKSDHVVLFIQQKAKTLKLKLSSPAIQLLINACGDNLMFLNNTMEKLSLLSDEGQVIDEADVEKLYDECHDYSGFDLAEALSKKDLKKVLDIYFELYEENPYQSAELLGLLNWQIKRIYEAKKLMIAGVQKDEIARKLKLRPYFLNRFLSQVAAFKENNLKDCIQFLFETDKDIKTGKVSVKAAMEMLLLKIGLA